MASQVLQASVVMVLHRCAAMHAWASCSALRICVRWVLLGITWLAGKLHAHKAYLIMPDVACAKVAYASLHPHQMPVGSLHMCTSTYCATSQA